MNKSRHLFILILYLFYLTSVAPFSPIITHSGCRNILRNIIDDAGVESHGRIYGTRITRHSMASRMLRHGVPLPVISESLGHGNQNSAMIYITTDDIKLSGCTLPLPCWKEGMIVNDKSVSLRDLATAFVLYKQSLGYVYNTQVHYLLKYISFSENRYPECQVPCKDAVNEFLANVSDRKGSLYGIVCALREYIVNVSPVNHRMPTCTDGNSFFVNGDYTRISEIAIIAGI